MTEYDVTVTDGMNTWEVQIEADSPSEATLEACNMYPGFISARISPD